MASVTSLLRIAGEGRMDYHLFSLPLGTRGGNTMYKVITKEDTIRIPAEYMRRGHSLNQHIDRLAASAFEGRFDEMNRFILVTANHEPLGRGRIIHGDGAVYQEVRFDALLYCMDDYEVVEGAVSEVNEFGAFVRIGPMEALLHKSQILDEPINVNPAESRIEGAKSGKLIEVGTNVRSRIVSKAINQNDPRSSKIGLNCKMAGLGAHQWIDGDE